jgi:hypothetical protein
MRSPPSGFSRLCPAGARTQPLGPGIGSRIWPTPAFGRTSLVSRLAHTSGDFLAPLAAARADAAPMPYADTIIPYNVRFVCRTCCMPFVAQTLHGLVPQTGPWLASDPLTTAGAPFNAHGSRFEKTPLLHSVPDLLQPLHRQVRKNHRMNSSACNSRVFLILPSGASW